MQWNKFDWNDRSTWPEFGTEVLWCFSHQFEFGRLCDEGDEGVGDFLIEVDSGGDEFQFFPLSRSKPTHWMLVVRPE